MLNYSDRVWYSNKSCAYDIEIKYEKIYIPRSISRLLAAMEGVIFHSWNPVFNTSYCLGCHTSSLESKNTGIPDFVQYEYVQPLCHVITMFYIDTMGGP